MQEHPNNNEPQYKEFPPPPPPLPPPPPGPVFPAPYPTQYGGPAPYPPYAPQYGGPVPFPPQKLPNRRTAGGIILSIVFYLWGATSAVIGFAYMLSVAASASDVTIGATAIVLGIISIIALVVILILHKHPLRWWIRLLAELGALVVGFIILIIAVALTTSTYGAEASSPQTNIIVAIVFLIYGLATMFLALW